MIWRDRTLRRLALVAACVIIGAKLTLGGLAHINPLDPLPTISTAQQQSVAANDNLPVLTPARLRHITDGDRRGGGHLHGTGAPCKSEFPASWTREKIAHDIPLLAANDNLDWQHGNNGYMVSEGTADDGLKIRIVLDPRDNEIITAYPVNVRRNPCTGANDNTRD